MIFEGEGRGIKSTQLSNIVSKIDNNTGGLNEGLSHDRVHCHVGASDDQNAGGIAFLGEVGQVDMKSHHQFCCDQFTASLDDARQDDWVIILGDE